MCGMCACLDSALEIYVQTSAKAPTSIQNVYGTCVYLRCKYTSPLTLIESVAGAQGPRAALTGSVD